jgi:hypothetical protein
MAKQCQSTPSAHEISKLPAQGGFANAGLTHNQDQAALTSHGRFERRNEPAQFSLPADKRGPPLPRLVIARSPARPLGIG